MKKPLSFKGLLKPKLNPISGLTPSISPQDFKHKKVKYFVNKFKCPLCKCLMEGNLDSDIIHLKCAWVPEHFRIQLDTRDENNILMIFDQLIYIDNAASKKYVIYRHFDEEQKIENRISIYKIDGNGDVLNTGTRSSAIIIPGNIFDYSKLDEEKIRKLINTVLIFS